MRFFFKKAFLMLLGISLSPDSFSQPAEYKMSRVEYIEKFKEDAIKEMLLYGIPASITIAQAILESSDGNSPLAKYANNHFGIKCHKGWEGPTFIQDDDTKNECFRKYFNVNESYRDHSVFLRTRRWYEPLFELKLTDYKGWAHGLKKAGYATNPRYAELLIKIIEENQLYELDRVTEMPVMALKAEPETKAEIKVRTPHSPVVIPEIEEKAISISLKNNIKYIIARQSDNPLKIAKDMDMAPWQIYKYNDLEKGERIKPGDVIYLQPKRNKGKELFHIVKKGESLHSVSQVHGIKLKKIYQYNGYQPGHQVKAGDKIELRKKRR
jgi:hypothetical protein